MHQLNLYNLQQTVLTIANLNRATLPVTVTVALEHHRFPLFHQRINTKLAQTTLFAFTILPVQTYTQLLVPICARISSRPNSDPIDLQGFLTLGSFPFPHTRGERCGSC